ncbi:MAG: hypothetical protein ACM3N6_06355 [Betaproteobacteria bacterium]
MNLSIVIGVIIVALVAWFLWNRNKGGAVGTSAAPTRPAPSAAPSPAPMPAVAAGGPLGSYEEYRRVSPSNMVYGKLTCNRCGSNLLRTSAGVASCSSCGAALYRT